MSSTMPAMRGKFGNTEFFIVTMYAKELSDKLVIPKEMEGWDDMTIEEKFQREINYRRVKDHIAPYLAKDKERFFGAFIVAIKNHNGIVFEPLQDIVKSNLPKLYLNDMQRFGILILQGKEVLIPLDGQHRLAAIRFAISGKDEKGNDIRDINANTDVARDMCTVILVRYDDKKVRKIFNKVNRHAKKTTKTEDLITADDDIVAVITREDIASDDYFPARIVRSTSNTLNPTHHEFTTLPTLYEGTRLVLQDKWIKIKKDELPQQAEMDCMRQVARDFWGNVCNHVALVNDAIKDPTENGDAKRREIRREYVLGKPFAQLALVHAILRLLYERDDGSKLSWHEIGKRINNVSWRITDPLWDQVIMRGKRILSGTTAVAFAGRFLAYHMGEPLDDVTKNTLRSDYQSRVGEDKELPEPMMTTPKQER